MDLIHLHMLSGMMVINAAGGGLSPIAQVVTHIVCFVIVFFILKRFAFGPIVDVIEKRREKIESDLKRAENARKLSEENQAKLEERLKHIEEEARARMQELIQEGKTLAEAIQEKARKQANDLIQKAQQNIEYETEKARETIKNEVIDLVVRATERLVKEQLDDQKHRELIGDFLTQIERN